MKDITVLYEDKRVMAVYKPYGTAVQGGEKVTHPLIDTIDTLFGSKHYLVHRLDKDTSGILLVAKTPADASLFSRLLAQKNTYKEYRAVCFGSPVPPRGYISDDISRKGEVKTAGTHYETLAVSGDFSLLSLRLDTGRMHQIRIHLASKGNPIVADDKYGDFPRNRSVRSQFGARKLMLAAVHLSVPGAKSDGSVLELDAPIPEHMNAFLEKAGFHY